jgi:hypothetical protein
MHISVKRKWRLLFGLYCLAVALLFMALRVYPLKQLLLVDKNDLSRWYPHLGLSLFYLLKTAVWLQKPLAALALGGLLYFLISWLAAAVKKLNKSTGGRTTQFKLMGAVLALVPLVILIKLSVGFFKAPGSADYALNDAVNKRNDSCASNNLFGFTDRNHTPAKPRGVYRIAVLGDSFIWGDGLPYEQAWSHQLERKLLAKYDSVEVLHWGKCGWSTLDEFNFYKQHGKDYGINLLIIGWVDNDPDVGKWPDIRPLSVEQAYPILSQVYPTLARRWANSQEIIATNKWYDHLYSDENLKDYKKLLTDFYDTLRAQNVESLVVMTPSPFLKLANWKFARAEPLIRQSGFPCFNLYGPAHKNLCNYSLEQLQANPVNGHPGVLMTEEFANEVMGYLEANHYLDSLARVNP